MSGMRSPSLWPWPLPCSLLLPALLCLLFLGLVTEAPPPPPDIKPSQLNPGDASGGGQPTAKPNFRARQAAAAATNELDPEKARPLEPSPNNAAPNIVKEMQGRVLDAWYKDWNSFGIRKIPAEPLGTLKTSRQEYLSGASGRGSRPRGR